MFPKFAHLLPVLPVLILALCRPADGWAADAGELARNFKQLPTVAEAELPPLSNATGPFRGVVKHDGLDGQTWVAFPFVENPASLGIDPMGRIFVTEANRFWLGVPDLRGANEMIRADFKSVTVADRLAMYAKFASHFPEGWFSAVADRIVRFEDRDGNGAPDHRALFSDRFREPEDGIGFSVLAEREAVYFTCIPKLWKLTDPDDDGRADTHEALADGFGVRVSFIGHDLHGIVRGPDGRLYFSVGDRSYHVTTADGRTHDGAGTGAVFRCESDGSGLEVVATGLRNPQELGFDASGNLFTFDNNGDIGDEARMVYVLEGSDSGWNMAHQSAHQYAQALDWGEFRPSRSVWVDERMFDLWNEAQPQWVYPPASHVSNGPSGFVWLTGEAIPEDLRERFLLTNYRGGAENSNTLAVALEPKGAGYVARDVRELLHGVAASDVELGFDGRIFLADYGGGWSVNTNGSIQVLASKSDAERRAGAEVAKLMAEGFGEKNPGELIALLGHADLRVGQAAQFELVERGALEELAETSVKREGPMRPRLHALWALGQLGRKGTEVANLLLPLLADPETEIVANAARVLGDLRESSARGPLLELLAHASPRARSLAAVALGRICESGDTEAIAALYSTQTEPVDVVLRHAIVSALERVGTVDAAVARAGAASPEQRLLAVLFLRRHASPQLTAFLGDVDPLIRKEVIRAIYDTAALDSDAGQSLAQLDPNELPEALQRRIVAANYRLGQPDNARRMLALAADDSLGPAVREFALHGLARWSAAIEADPVLGHYRPQVVAARPKDQLGNALTAGLRQFLAAKRDPKLVALATRLANDIGVALDEATLRAQVADASLDAEVRVATLDSLMRLGKPGDDAIVRALLGDADPEVRAAAIRQGFALQLNETNAVALEALASGPLVAARAAIAGLDPAPLRDFWNSREDGLRRELWLDVYLRLLDGGDETVKAWTGSPQSLTTFGGDAARGERVFRNQGACMQCHLMGDEGGVQGPDLTLVADRLPSDQLLQSLIEPNAVIAEGYGMAAATLKDGSALVGRLAEQSETEILLIGLDGTESRLQRADIAALTPPVSAMPPLALTLPLPEVRDLVAFLASRTRETAGDAQGADHGESRDEKIAK